MIGNDILKIDLSYWENFQICEDDIEFIFNNLLELETPQTPAEIANSLIAERIIIEKKKFELNQNRLGEVYLPKKHFNIDDKIVFPGSNFRDAKVLSIRPGINPTENDFSVIEVEFSDHSNKFFAADLLEHSLNDYKPTQDNDPNLSFEHVRDKYGKIIIGCLIKTLESIDDLVRIAGKWFPRSLLVDINIGHLNITEAVLEEANGGPLTSQFIISQIELPKNVNPKLVEFSLNLALEEDQRFDEVGPAGETLWFLHRFEPDYVRNVPLFLKYTSDPSSFENSFSSTQNLNCLVVDELEPNTVLQSDDCTFSFALLYPHWRVGTIPLSESLKRFFPTAYEAPRIRFLFVDKVTNETFPGWVIRPSGYVFGLREWYVKMGLIPGSRICLEIGSRPGEVLIYAEKRRQNKEWIRTVLVGKDGGIVFATVKQMVNASFDERMAIAVPDIEPIDLMWQKNIKSKESLEKYILFIMQDLAKLNPQGHIHAQELYAAVNITRRCPPSVIIHVLNNNPKVTDLGNLYYRISGETSDGY